MTPPHPEPNRTGSSLPAGVWPACISAGRPQNVERMERLCGPLHWYVRSLDVSAYREAGAKSVIAAGGLVAARNLALEHAFSAAAWCLQVSDDLTGVKFALGKKRTREGTFREAVNYLRKLLVDSPFRLAGVAPTTNAFFFNPREPVRSAAFILGDLMLVRPTPLRFDPELRLKEDYDFTLQHIERYGGVVRADAVLAAFLHRRNAGGAVDYRTNELEQASIRYLVGKWGNLVRRNGARRNEVVLNLRAK